MSFIYGDSIDDNLPVLICRQGEHAERTAETLMYGLKNSECKIRETQILGAYYNELSKYKYFKTAPTFIGQYDLNRKDSLPLLAQIQFDTNRYNYIGDGDSQVIANTLAKAINDTKEDSGRDLHAASQGGKLYLYSYDSSFDYNTTADNLAVTQFKEQFYNNLIAFYVFNEYGLGSDSGFSVTANPFELNSDIVLDVSGNKNHSVNAPNLDLTGTSSYDVVLDTSGAGLTEIEFSGTFLDELSDLTVFFRFSIDSDLSNDQAIVYRDNTLDIYYDDTSSAVKADLTTKNSTSTVTSASPVSTSSTYYEMAITYDGSDLKIYSDVSGSFIEDDSASLTGDLQVVSNALYLGSRGGTNTMNGNMTHIAFYDEAKSSNTLSNMYGGSWNDRDNSIDETVEDKDSVRESIYNIWNCLSTEEFCGIMRGAYDILDQKSQKE